MQALILAAGMGRRLAPLTHETPKCLIEVNGVPIIINALDHLRRFNLRRIVIVIGHLGEMVIENVGHFHHGIPVEYIWNNDFEETNNVYSLWLAREFFNDDTILLECDVYFEFNVIEPLLSNAAGNIALIDNPEVHRTGTMAAVNAEGMVHRIITAQDQGIVEKQDRFKTVNIYSIGQTTLQTALLPALERHIKTGGRDAFYEQVIGELIHQGNAAFSAISVHGTKWVEIDDSVDLGRATRLFSSGEELYEKVTGSFGGYWNFEFIDFSHLHNPHFPVPQLLEELKHRMNDLICGYPSGQAVLANRLAEWVGIDPSFLVVGNGTSELISILKNLIVRRATIPTPSFNEYHEGLNEDQIHYFPTRPNGFVLDPERFVAETKNSRSNVAIILNPDLPSGALLSIEAIEFLLRELSGLDAFVLDESFIDFTSADTPPSLLPRLRSHKNLVILRSLSKDLGVPGLRLGYAATANPSLSGSLRAAAPIWNVNALAEHFLTILPRYRESYHQSLLKVIEDRTRFAAGLSQIEGIKAYPSAGNFIFVQLPAACNSATLTKHLFIHHAILIKDCSNKKGLQQGSFVRLAVRSRNEIDEFLEKFAVALKECTESP